ncbi:MAG: hypothetical protein HUJ25_11735 [Crocinitomicaceae bacterium]|nr:hypothetical protein [Crocinitomicaceae bacterium]
MKSLILSLSVASMFVLTSFTSEQAASIQASSTVLSLDDDLNLNDFRVQLCSYKSVVPVSVVEKLRKVKGVTSLRNGEEFIYLSPSYSSKEEAFLALPTFQYLGFNEAQVVRVERSTTVGLKIFQGPSF